MLPFFPEILRRICWKNLEPMPVGHSPNCRDCPSSSRIRSSSLPCLRSANVSPQELPGTVFAELFRGHGAEELTFHHRLNATKDWPPLSTNSAGKYLSLRKLRRNRPVARERAEGSADRVATSLPSGLQLKVRNSEKMVLVRSRL